MALTLRWLARQEAAVRRRSQRPLQYVIMDLSPVPHIDATAVRMLQDLVREYQREGLQLVISNPSNRVFGMMENSGLLEQVGAPRAPQRGGPLGGPPAEEGQLQRTLKGAWSV